MNRYKKGGGYSLQHWVAISLYLDKIHEGLIKGKDAKGNTVIENDLYPGQWSRCKIYKNHSGPKFFNEFVAYLEWGRRFLTAAELLEMGTSLSVIKQGGAWYTVGDERFNGKKNAIVGIDTNPELQSWLWEEVKKMQLLGRDPIVDVADWEEGADDTDDTLVSDGLAEGFDE
jgi:recombination protein RecA